MRKPLLAVFVLALCHVPALSAAAQRVFVADQTAGTIHQYSVNGDDLGVFAGGLAAPSCAGSIYVSEYNQGGPIRKFSSWGEELLSIATTFIPAGVRVASDGTIYVAEYGRGVYRYTASGGDLGLFVSTVGGNDFIAFDADGHLYIANFNRGAIRRISPTGVDLGDFVSGLDEVEGIVFGSGGDLYAPATARIKRGRYRFSSATVTKTPAASSSGARCKSGRSNLKGKSALGLLTWYGSKHVP